MDEEARHDTDLADAFMRKCILHIGNASNVQKIRLLKTLLERPPETANKLELAQSIWNGLEHKEITMLLGTLQKQFDKDTWDFIARWRK